MVLSLSAKVSSALTVTCILTSPSTRLVNIAKACNGIAVSAKLGGSLGLLTVFKHRSIPIFHKVSRPDSRRSFRIPPSSKVFRKGGKANGMRVPTGTAQAITRKSTISFVVSSIHRCNSRLICIPANTSAGLSTTFTGTPSVVSGVGMIVVNNTLARPNGVGVFVRTGVSRSPTTSGQIFTAGTSVAVVNLSIAVRAVVAGGSGSTLHTAKAGMNRFLTSVASCCVGVDRRCSNTFLKKYGLRSPLTTTITVSPALIGYFPVGLVIRARKPKQNEAVNGPGGLLSRPGGIGITLRISSRHFIGHFVSQLVALTGSYG